MTELIFSIDFLFHRIHWLCPSYRFHFYITMWKGVASASTAQSPCVCVCAYGFRIGWMIYCFPFLLGCAEHHAKCEKKRKKNIKGVAIHRCRTVSNSVRNTHILALAWMVILGSSNIDWNCYGNDGLLFVTSFWQPTSKCLSFVRGFVGLAGHFSWTFGPSGQNG